MDTTYTVIAKREGWYEVKNAYVRWDDYGGGDSAWRGGDIYVWRKNDPPMQDPVWQVAEPVKKAVIRWCERWLPNDRSIRESPGWEAEIRITEMEPGLHGSAPTIKLEPIISPAIREMILRKAAEIQYIAL